MKQYDLAVMGAGIVGLAAAYAAAKRGLQVAVIEKNSQCLSASMRGFGFVSVTGQRAGSHWQRAMQSRDIWSKLSQRADIKVLHTGLLIPAYRPEAAAVVDAFLETEMGEMCRLLDEEQALQIVPAVRTGAQRYLWSPHELRVESHTAIPQLAAWLTEEYQVAFHYSTTVCAVDLPHIHTSTGSLEARYFVGCPGHDLSQLPKEVIDKAEVRICTAQMLRLKPEAEDTLNAAVMSDLSLARYEGFTALPEAKALEQRLDEEMEASRDAGIHLIAARSANGSLVVGNSHVYSHAEVPFSREHYDQLVLEAFDAVLDLPKRRVIERWSGSYASAPEPVLAWQPSTDSIIGVVTGGTGTSTGFAFGEELVSRLLNE
ncbi:MAG: TIGR03364 family FAD-dependent oxidoreductase [Proteobacteria bacterium]|nr:MAG: TIGR03364 family FAD-dependent oxidoreductase [Pseudomonadota bacterium]